MIETSMKFCPKCSSLVVYDISSFRGEHETLNLCSTCFREKVMRQDFRTKIVQTLKKEKILNNKKAQKKRIASAAKIAGTVFVVLFLLWTYLIDYFITI